MQETKLNRILDRILYGSLLVFAASLTFSTALMEITSVTSLAAWALLKIRTRRMSVWGGWIFWALAGFVAVSVVSYTWSEYPPQSFRGVFKILQQFFLFWTVADTFQNRSRGETLFKVMAVSFAILTVDGIWQYASGRDLLRGISFEHASSGKRISASFKNYGLLASYLVTFLPLFFTPWKEKGWLWKLLSTVALAGGTLLLFWTRSRGAWLAFVGSALFYVWFSTRRIYVILILLASIGGALLLPRSMLIHLDYYGQEQSIVERFDLWERAIDVMRAKPWSGTGINTYNNAHQKYDTRKTGRVAGYYAHNGFLQMGAEIGIPGLILFLFFVFFYFRVGGIRLRHMEDEERARLLSILTGVFGFLLLAGVDTTLHNPQAVLAFWLLAGWGLAMFSNPEVFSRPD